MKRKTIKITLLSLWSVGALVLGVFIVKWTMPYLGEDKSLMLGVLLACIMTIPPVVLFSLSGSWVKNRKQSKKDGEEALSCIERQNEEQRKNYSVPDDILTWYEYYKIHLKEEIPSKARWTILATLEVLCLTLIFGAPFLDGVLPAEGVAVTMYLGFVVGIYGFCVLLGAYIKGILYSIIPPSCYLLPLAVVYFLGVRLEWVLFLVTFLVGSAIFILSIAVTVVIPQRRRQKVADLWEEELSKTFSSYNECFLNFYEDSHFSYRYLNRTLNMICLDNGVIAILMTDNIVYHGTKIKDAIIYAQKVNMSVEDAHVYAFDLLKNYKWGD